MVSYYTIHYEGKSTNEFDEFLTKSNANSNVKDDLKSLLLFIKKLGNRPTRMVGIHDFFKGEDAAYRFDRNFEKEKLGALGLRLYCLPLNPSNPRIIFLFNGCEKTARKNAECDNCRNVAREAHRISQKIDEALLDGSIRLKNNNTLLDVDLDFEL